MQICLSLCPQRDDTQLWLLLVATLRKRLQAGRQRVVCVSAIPMQSTSEKEKATPVGIRKTSLYPMQEQPHPPPPHLYSVGGGEGVDASFRNPNLPGIDRGCPLLLLRVGHP